jgi:hypothetical protein
MAIDLNQNDSIDEGYERVTKTERSYLSPGAGHPAVLRADTYGWVLEDWVPVRVDISRHETSVDGLEDSSMSFNGENAVLLASTEVSYSANAKVVVATSPTSKTTRTYSRGWLSSVVTSDAANNVRSSVTYEYDAYGRQCGVVDGANGRTSITFNSAGLVTSVTKPASGVLGEGQQVTRYDYDQNLRKYREVFPDGTSVTNLYTPAGLVRMVVGS